MFTGKFDEKGKTGMIGVREIERKYECGYQNYINNATLSSLELSSPRLRCALIKFSCVYRLSRISRCYFSSATKETSEILCRVYLLFHFLFLLSFFFLYRRQGIMRIWIGSSTSNVGKGILGIFYESNVDKVDLSDGLLLNGETPV